MDKIINCLYCEGTGADPNSYESEIKGYIYHDLCPTCEGLGTIVIKNE